MRASVKYMVIYRYREKYSISEMCRFFKAVASCWATTAPRESYEYFSQTDVHSAENLRVNRVLVNIEEFYKTFGITEEDGMYVAPEKRVKIW